MQRVTIKVEWSGEKKKKKAIKMVSENQDVQSFSVDEENKQLTMEGEMDPVTLVKKMRRHFPTEIVSMRSAPTAGEAQQPVYDPRPPYIPQYPTNIHDRRPSAPPYDGGYYGYPPPYGSPQYPYNPWGPSGGGYGGYNSYHGP